MTSLPVFRKNCFTPPEALWRNPRSITGNDTTRTWWWYLPVWQNHPLNCEKNAGMVPLKPAHHFIHLFGLTSSALGVWRGFLAPCRPLVLRPSPTIAHTWPNLVVPSRHLSRKSRTDHTILETFLWSFSESNSSDGKSTPMTRLEGVIMDKLG